MTCSYPGCDKPVRARSWCVTHYSRWQRRGTVELTTPPVLDRFWANIEKGEHWLWIGSVDKDGYGKMFDRSYRDRGLSPQVRAHRWSFERFVRWLLPGEQALHRCDIPACCSPDCLFAGTNADNMRDRNAKLRQAHGENHAMAKLSAETVAAIRSTAGMSHRTLAAEFGISKTQVGRILRGESWHDHSGSELGINGPLITSGKTLKSGV